MLLQLNNLKQILKYSSGHFSIRDRSSKLRDLVEVGIRHRIARLVAHLYPVWGCALVFGSSQREGRAVSHWGGWLLSSSSRMASSWRGEYLGSGLWVLVGMSTRKGSKSEWRQVRSQTKVKLEVWPKKVSKNDKHDRAKKEGKKSLNF
jgi:hypothetical protein